MTKTCPKTPLSTRGGGNEGVTQVERLLLLQRMATIGFV
jgi:hypothetical protein